MSKIFKDVAVRPDSANDNFKALGILHGFKSIKSTEQIKDLAGVLFDSFNFLLKRMNSDVHKNSKLSLENNFLFLIKIKTGITYSALCVLFGIHRKIVSNILFSTLHDLVVSATDNLVF